MTETLMGWCQHNDEHHARCRTRYTRHDGTPVTCTCPNHHDDDPMGDMP